MRKVAKKERYITLKSALCGKSFQSASNLRKHVEAVHEKKEFECTECNENFKSEYTYKQHMAFKHEGKEMYKCEMCKVELKSKFSLKNHMAFMHEGQEKKKYDCSACGAIFKQKSTLMKHIETTRSEHP